MKLLSHFAVLMLLQAGAMAAPADDKPKDNEGFVPMFDGRTLQGWINVNCAPSTFYVKDGEIITTGKPTGYLRTEKQYENFIAEFDWMHVPPEPGEMGNSGFFVWADPIPAVGSGYTRGIEVQVLVNLTYKNKQGEITATSQGDLFSIWGARCTPDRPHPDGWERCLPSENHCQGDREWNHYRVEANDGRITLAVNGHVVSGVSRCNPRKGYLALESEGSECHFKNLKIKELPSTSPTKDEVADEDKGFRSLYTGLDLSGWNVDKEATQHWRPKDWGLTYDGKAEGKGNALRTEGTYGGVEILVDFSFPAMDVKPCAFLLHDGDDGHVRVTVSPNGRVVRTLKDIIRTQGPQERTQEHNQAVTAALKPPGQWNRLLVSDVGGTFSVTVNGTEVKALTTAVSPRKGAFVLMPGGEMDFANLFVREFK